MTNKKLILIFVVLLGLYLLSRVFQGHKSSTFDPNVVSVDTAAVTEIHLYPKAENGAEIILRKTGDGWTAEKEGKVVQTPYTKISGILSQLSLIQSERIVAKGEDNWKPYEVDEQGSHVEVYAGKKRVADFVVGTFKFDQAKRSASSYMRNTDDNSVHLVQGFMSMAFNQGFNAFRPSHLLTVKPEDLTSVTVSDDAGKIAISRNPADAQWYRNGMELLDSAKVAQYLGQLANVTSTNFTEPVQGQPVSVLEISGNNLSSPVVVECYATSDTLNPFVLHSSQNADAYFGSDSSGVYQRLFEKFDALLSPVE